MKTINCPECHKAIEVDCLETAAERSQQLADIRAALEAQNDHP